MLDLTLIPACDATLPEVRVSQHWIGGTFVPAEADASGWSERISPSHGVVESSSSIGTIQATEAAIAAARTAYHNGRCSPAMNSVPATVVTEGGHPHASIPDADGTPRHLRVSQANLAQWASKPILLGIRPEAITDPEGAERKSRNIVALKNRVAVTEPDGADTFATMTLSGRDTVARRRAEASVAPGKNFDFAINMEKAVAFDPNTKERIIA